MVVDLLLFCQKDKEYYIPTYITYVLSYAYTMTTPCVEYVEHMKH